MLGTDTPSPAERCELRLRFEAVQRSFLDDWAGLDQQLRTPIDKRISSFRSLFDEPGVASPGCRNRAREATPDGHVPPSCVRLAKFDPCALCSSLTLLVRRNRRKPP